MGLMICMEARGQPATDVIRNIIHLLETGSFTFNFSLLTNLALTSQCELYGSTYSSSPAVLLPLRMYVPVFNIYYLILCRMVK